jgi:hypothetical protein
MKTDTDTPAPARAAAAHTRAAAEMAFRSTVVTVAPEAKESAMSEYKATQEAARLRMQAQRAARLARDAAQPAPARRRGKA